MTSSTTRRRHTKRSIATKAALVTAALIVAATAAGPAVVAASPSPPAEQPVPGMAQMPAQMMNGNNGMQQMHERTQQNPGMVRVHELRTRAGSSTSADG